MLHEEVNILVVDDVNSMRAQVKELLKSLGFRNITLASNGEEAKKHMAVTNCHLVLCDWHMAPTDGLELLKHVRTDKTHKDVAFIMVTAEGTKEKVIECIKSGVDDYLVKPLTKVQIETKVYAVLLRKKVLG